MALDYASVPFRDGKVRPKKRLRPGWDVPGDSALLRTDYGSQIFSAPDLSYSSIAHASHDELGFIDSQHISNFATRNASPPWREDDKDGHYNFEIGETLSSRYLILGKMGEGTFGRVIECRDLVTGESVAVKVIRSAQKYRDAAMIEVDVLQTLNEKDRTRSRGCVQIRSWFDYRNHICIVFEKLGPSLYEFLRVNNYRPFSVDLVRDFGRQLLESVAYMHGLRLIHTDLKPENVLLASSDYTKIIDYKVINYSHSCNQGIHQIAYLFYEQAITFEFDGVIQNTTKHLIELKRVPLSSKIKLIDFGSTAYDREDSFSVVSTRHYRAPEVILGLGWSYPCDVWSVGCILVELCSGEVLFQTHENLEHLAMMERVLGPIPFHIIKRAMHRSEKYFNYYGLNWPEGALSTESVRAVRRLPRLKNLIMEHIDNSGGLLIDLLECLLRYDSSERLTAKEALEHPFFRLP